MNKTSVLTISLIVLLVLLFYIGVLMQKKNVAITSVNPKNMQKIEIQSPAFQNGQVIPKKYTCDGENLIPPIQISNIPKDTKSLALIIEDPDAPGGTWDHLVMWNLPAQEFSTREGTTPVGMIGRGSGGNESYEGPCPPKGKPHRYFFNLFAIDTLINLPAGSSKEQLLETMDKHIIGEGEWLGTYSRG